MISTSKRVEENYGSTDNTALQVQELIPTFLSLIISHKGGMTRARTRRECVP